MWPIYSSNCATEHTFTTFEIQIWLPDFILGTNPLRTSCTWPIWAEVTRYLGNNIIISSVFHEVASLVLGYSYDCSSVYERSLKDMYIKSTGTGTKLLFNSRLIDHFWDSNDLYSILIYQIPQGNSHCFTNSLLTRCNVEKGKFWYGENCKQWDKI